MVEMHEYYFLKFCWDASMILKRTTLCILYYS